MNLDGVDAGDWQPACDALARKLTDASWQGSRIHVVISDHWARYAILPWSAELTGEAERMAHAKLLLNNTYGDIGEDWAVCLSEARPNMPALISALPANLIRQIDE